MCGFAGYLECSNEGPKIDTKTNVNAEAQREALKTIKNRGPDSKVNGMTSISGWGIAGYQS